MFGAPVELLVTDKASYAGTATHWRRAEARHVAARVRELVDAGEATAGEIVLLFAAGTDAEQYEEELRKAGLPTYRATGRGYFGQQQVVDLLAYLRLLHNRYDDEALLTVLASPFVGLSNDALVLVRRAAPQAPALPAVRARAAGRALGGATCGSAGRSGSASSGSRGVATALRSSGSASGSSPSTTTTSPCSRSGTAAAGTRTCASSRGSRARSRSCAAATSRASSASSREQEAVGARELEAVAEEEGADAVRLLTIHAAKGLEFKVVIVADAGRDRTRPRRTRSSCLPDGRFGFRVADPADRRRGGRAFAYEQVREARAARRSARSGCASTTSR